MAGLMFIFQPPGPAPDRSAAYIAKARGELFAAALMLKRFGHTELEAKVLDALEIVAAVDDELSADG